MSTFDLHPSIALPKGEKILRGSEGWTSVGTLATTNASRKPALIAVDAYPGVDIAEIIHEVKRALPGFHVIDMEDRAARASEVLLSMMAGSLTLDRVFGVMNHFELSDFYDAAQVGELREEISQRTQPILVVGWGASLACDSPGALVLADVSRWELQRRQRAVASNWRAGNGSEDSLRKYKRGYFVEWRTADRHKRSLFQRIDFFLDANEASTEMGFITGGGFRQSLIEAAQQPFRLVPFFDPGVWGGQWMKKQFGLDPEVGNYAWCFDCVPEENSLRFHSSAHSQSYPDFIEMPAMNLVLSEPILLLGAKTYARFGAEFPIRFDFLDTMGGKNLSLQVHPSTDYIKNTFGMSYTQDESYYILDCAPEASVYLGIKDGVKPKELLDSLSLANEGQGNFDADQYINKFPVTKHDHFSIPAGTVHCSGANSMVLEISATPFIFTFKLWDWDRVGIDGLPRPIHLEHGAANIDWSRDTDWVNRHLLNQVEVIHHSESVLEERTGLHQLEFLEVRRHWFADSVAHDTHGTVNVLNLVEGDQVEVISSTGLFEPFVVHYAETFVIPASVGEYVIQRSAASQSDLFATVKASVRDTEINDAKARQKQ